MEHVAREAEMARRLEGERRSHGEERETMRNQMDQLAKMVVRSVITAGAKSPAELGIKLVALRDSDDIEVYLVTFEQIMAAHKIKKSMAALCGSTADQKGAVSICGTTNHRFSKIQCNQSCNPHAL